MKISEAKQEIAQFLPQKNLIYIRGYIMVGIGVLIALGTIIAPNVGIMSFKNAWLPVASFVILFTGVVEAFDTYISRNTPRFYVNLQFAILDLVVGWVVLFSLNYPAYKLSILIAVFLMIKGLFRVIGAYAGHFATTKPTMIGGGISFLLGFLIWVQWPGEPTTAILSFCLSVEIALRGWALVRLAEWLGNLEE
ncbi:hypothetical protein Q9L42_019190 [Methylomarinum sp. Ch1-1]|uniref:HdeD family acid-resistance protein n=1 Tax=Methylomarinum roseum TaxID=3067653 RepID=A0AAU7NU17_9GAMM|nr:hypothetical protein [Methylomarinum sp. Ch1-1]MDP4519484.1 hypothetical protein [Methylomarinum sp. Ch1-1]